MSNPMGLSVEQLQWLQALGGLQGMPGLGYIPQMAAQVSALNSPPPPSEDKSFPLNASILAALGSVAGGLQAGQPPRPPMAGTPQVVARAPGGFRPVYNQLPVRR